MSNQSLGRSTPELAIASLAVNAELLREWFGEENRSMLNELQSESLWIKRTLAIVSSHSQRRQFESKVWQARLVVALRYAMEQQYNVLFHDESPYADAISQACKRLKVPAIKLQRGPRPPKMPNASIRNLDSETVVSLPFAKETNGNANDMQLGWQSISILDRATIALAGHLFAIEVRPGGKIASLIRSRLKNNSLPPSSVKLFLGRSEDRAWLRLGAIGWIVDYNIADHRIDPSIDSTETAWLSCRNVPPVTIQPVICVKNRIVSDNKQNYLIHCTRSREGAWPDQTTGQYWDELLQHQGFFPTTPLHSLLRILSLKRIFATRTRLPGSVPAISFSSCPLDCLLGRRTFQSHLGHWDWEPYGVMISREWLASQGAKPVEYRSRSEFQGLNQDELTFTQVYSEKGKERDWRIEQEWRLASDLPLDMVPTSEAFVFVQNEAEARTLQHISMFPLLALNRMGRGD